MQAQANRIFNKHGIRAFIVAEVAQSYEGKIEVAKQLIKGLANSGTDAVMFQLVKANELTVAEHKNHQLFRSLEMSPTQWQEIFQTIRDHGLHGVGEIFGPESAEVAHKAGAHAFKIHAADVGNHRLLKFVASFNKPILLSAGGSTAAQIERALQILREAKAPEVVLMHGYQLAPTPIAQTNLLKIKALAERFKVDVGYADHVAGCVDDDIQRPAPYALYVPALAAIIGAKVIEKHVILDRSKKWEDYESALATAEFKNFIETFRALESSFGSMSIDLNEAETEYGSFAKKSVVAATAIPAGKALTIDDLELLRVNDRTKGFTSVEEVLGKKSKTGIARHQLLRSDELM